MTRTLTAATTGGMLFEEVGRDRCRNQLTTVRFPAT